MNEESGLHRVRFPGHVLHRLYRLLMIFACGILLLPLTANVFAQDPYEDSLIHDTEGLMFRIRFEVLTPDGIPARDFDAWLKGGFSNDRNSCSIDGHVVTATFDPAFKGGFIPELVIRSDDGLFGTNVSLQSRELRRWSLQGHIATLEPMKPVRYRVVDEADNPVSGATVHVDGYQLTTGEEGFAQFQIPSKANRARFANARAVDSDGRVGSLEGFQMSDEELAAPFFEITVVEGAQQTIRLVAGDGTPVSGVLITPQPMTREITCVPHNGYPCFTDDNGEVIVTFVPQAPDARGKVFVSDSNWTGVDQQRVGDTWTVNVADFERSTFSGKINLPEGEQGGFTVKLTSFDHPQESRVDQLSTVCDHDGNFSIKVMRDAIYAVFVSDGQWVSDNIAGVLVDENGEAQLDVELNLQKGIPVTVTYTQGEGRIPVEGTPVYLSQYFDFNMRGGGMGRAGDQWYGVTDTSGRVTTLAGPGELSASVYLNDFSTETSEDISRGGANTLSLHRQNIAPINISGRVIGTGESAAVSTADVYIAASDNRYEFSDETTVDESGRFSIEATGDRFAILVITADGTMAGSTFAGAGDAGSVEVELSETTDYVGQAIGTDGQPIEGRQFKLEILMEDPEAEETNRYLSQKVMATRMSMTDAEGYFRFENVPRSMVLRVSLISDDPNEIDYLSRQVLLLPGDDERPVDAYQMPIAQTPGVEQTLGGRLFRLFKFSRLSNTRALVILVSDEEIIETVREQLLTNPDVDSIFWYQPIVIAQDSYDDPTSDRQFTDHKWEFPDQRGFHMVAYDETGSEVERRFVPLDGTNFEAASEFLERNKGSRQNAREKFQDALREARESDRKVWAVLGGSRCYPCMLLADWMQKNKSVLEKDYVIVKVDATRDLHGEEIAALVNTSGQFGIPFHSIFGADGEMLIDSTGPLGNVGFPRGSREGIFHLKHMLSETANSITAEEIDSLLETLED